MVQRDPLDQKDFRPTHIYYKPTDLDYKTLSKDYKKAVKKPQIGLQHPQQIVYRHGNTHGWSKGSPWTKKTSGQHAFTTNPLTWTTRDTTNGTKTDKTPTALLCLH